MQKWPNSNFKFVLHKHAFSYSKWPNSNLAEFQALAQNSYFLSYCKKTNLQCQVFFNQKHGRRWKVVKNYRPCDLQKGKSLFTDQAFPSILYTTHKKNRKQEAKADQPAAKPDRKIGQSNRAQNNSPRCSLKTYARCQIDPNHILTPTVSHLRLGQEWLHQNKQQKKAGITVTSFARWDKTAWHQMLTPFFLPRVGTRWHTPDRSDPNFMIYIGAGSSLIYTT